ncbi:chromate transporter [Ensifer adhaerens]|uniref:Chromate transporter n=1 Tax=Ensifer adhaerens TaxID=106592 RepID=A0A9Q8YHR4_ENSAD|nr:chromate transporter [Ensifer adhaerens]USJ28407.1 chromate transporter [Ensifer adhaerens]
MSEGKLLALISVFAPLSLVAVGGGPSIFAGIQVQVVEIRQWMDAREFLHLFAISRAAPGPGTMISTLIGWEMAGFSGAVVGTLALFVPSSVLCFFLMRLWFRHEGKSWHAAVSKGLEPIGGGLILAGALSIGKLSSAGWLYWIVALGAALAFYVFPKLSPVLVLAAGGTAFVCWRHFAGGVI